MEVIVGDFGIVVVPRDAADTDRIMNHSSILRKYKVSLPFGCWECSGPFSGKVEETRDNWPYPLSVVLSPQNNIMVVKDDINHPMSVVSSTKSRYVGGWFLGWIVPAPTFPL